MTALSRLPNVLTGAGVALLGWAVGPLVGEDQWRPIGGVLGGLIVALGLGLSSRRVRARLGWLPARSRLSALFGEVLDLRSQVKAAVQAGGIQKTDWDWRISELETKLWKEVETVLPDDWRVIKRGQRDFAGLNREWYKDDSYWAREMLKVLDERLKMLTEQMELLRA